MDGGSGDPPPDGEGIDPSGAAGSPARAAEALLDVVRAGAPPGARGWLAEALATAAPLDRAGFASAFALAARRVGRAPLEPAPAAQARLRAAGVTWPVASWGADGLLRTALLLRAATAAPPGELEALVTDCFAHGDLRERQAVLRALPLLPDPARFVPLAVEACRTSIEPVFEAIACENPYPARHFPEPSFNQMVLKAVFVGVPVGRILGLADRLTPELRRMARDYASERRAAGRSVPADLAALLADNGSAA